MRHRVEEAHTLAEVVHAEEAADAADELAEHEQFDADHIDLSTDEGRKKKAH